MFSSRPIATKKGNRQIPIPSQTFTINALTLGELKSGAGALLAVFFSFFDPRIAFDETGLFERQSEIRIDQNQRAGDAVPHGPGLSGDTAAGDRCADIIGADSIGDFERLHHFIAGGLNWKIFFHRVIVDRDLSVARFYPRSGNSGFASAGCVINVVFLHVFPLNKN